MSYENEDEPGFHPGFPPAPDIDAFIVSPGTPETCLACGESLTPGFPAIVLPVRGEFHAICVPCGCKVGSLAFIAAEDSLRSQNQTEDSDAPF